MTKTAAAAAMALALITAPYALVGTAAPAAAQDLASGDAAAGEKLFRRCMACHNVGPGATNKIGPELNNVFGRTPGTHADFRYSDAMQEFGKTHTWTPELVAQFIEAPGKLVVGTIMVFPGLRKPEDRANVIAYLATFDDEGTTVKDAPAAQ